MRSFEPLDFAVIAPQRIEFDAFKRWAGPLEETGNRDSFAIALEAFQGRVFSAARIGRVASAVLTQRVIWEHGPRVVLLAGTAGAFRRAASPGLGDLVVATSVIDYEDQRLMGAQKEYRLHEYPVSRRGLGAARDLLDGNSMFTGSQGARQVHFGPMLSGDKVMASRSASEELRDRVPEALGVEMEGAGVAYVIYETFPQTVFVMTRGIVDMADKAKRFDSTAHGRSTCNVLADFSLRIIERLLGSLPSPIND